MVTMQTDQFALIADDVMTRDVVALPRQTPMRDAARALRRASAAEAAVVDDEGRCVGALSAGAFVRWVDDGCPDAVDEPVPACRYQVKGRLLTGPDAVMCTLAEGGCPLQAPQPTTGGRHTSICLEPRGVVNDWQHVGQVASAGAVGCYMTADLVAATPATPVADLARRLGAAGQPFALVLDERGRPLGVVHGADLLAAAPDEPSSQL